MHMRRLPFFVEKQYRLGVAVGLPLFLLIRLAIGFFFTHVKK